ncbi:hypothetical protein BN159_p63 (plasmid) [Streptomyces davaonensis JCM 4913]|uniref:Uncharacterized protein n=1 Tax=Streptomyces davaonensis (strain DSM 101723 / JCM 4913 / KCC S-0913 / 768) TaxID=1214101 RepID=K4R9J0_STRDJ|nr:hypothetical protein BN159_p63 [Streptomyces davaonensis JCM 4913]
MRSSNQHDTATTGTTLPDLLCTHTPTCPTADSPDREAAHVVAAHPEQGWSLLCNAVLLFEDTGELLPDGRIVDPHRPTGATRPLRLAATHALIGGTARSGKTGAAALLQAASLASSFSTSRSA